MKYDNLVLASAQDGLRDVHNTYIKTISSQGMALSLETSSLVWEICNLLNPTSILDLGSGFSSYVTRNWTKNHPQTTTWSVDDDRNWLEQSKIFCKQQNVSIENFEIWDTFKRKDLKFDVVIYDLGRMQCRSENLVNGLNFKSQNGIVIVDDMHKFNYSIEVKQAIHNMNLTGYDMKKLTTDKHEGRHCWVVE